MAEFRVGRMYHDSGNPVVPPTFLADKQTLRVPVMMRDAVCTTCDDTGRMNAGIWCPDCGGKNSGKDNQLTDAETQMRDHLARDQEYRRIHSGNMPGYRFAADTEATRASRQQLADAYQEYETRLTSSWKDVGGEFTSDDPASRMNIGAGSPSKNFGRTRQEGDVCTMDNGRPGHIGANGECIPDRGSEDSRSVQDMMRDHQLKMAEETRLYENSVANAYKTLR